LFEAPSGSPWTAGYNPHLTVLDGREYLAVSEIDEEGRPSGVSRFIDLHTGGELRFVHERGYAGCYGTPARCVFTGPAIAEIELGDDSVQVREGTLFEFPGYYDIDSSDADYRDRRIVMAMGSIVELRELGTPEPIASIDLEGRRLQRFLLGADGRTERVLSWVQENPATGESAEVAVSALETAATPELIYRGRGGPMYGVFAVPHGEDWFVLRDGMVDEAAAVFVYGSDGAATLVGTLDDRWALGLDQEYRSGERSLETGPSAYVTDCDKDGCRTHRFWLDPVSLEEVASVALPEPGLSVDFSRRLACGGADVWLVTSAGADAPARFWSLRIPGRAGFP
jgi:hypothetical protein